MVRLPSTARLAIVSLGAFLPICLNVYDGARSLPAHYVEVAKTYHARWWNVWFGIALPASLPYVLAGFRLAVGRVLVGATVAEYVLSLKGLGYLIVYDSRSFHQDVMMVAVLVLALLGVVDQPCSRRRDAPAPALAPEVRVSSNGARIQIDGVAKEFGALRVFENIDLEIGEREIVSIVGPSGCGKTTLLRAIDGLVDTTEGEIRIDGQKVAGPPRGVAVVFQHFGLFPWKTVYENVAYGLRLAKASKEQIAESVPRHIELVGLKGFEKAYPYQLSGGMQQRTGLARALATDPHVLLMDEPFAAIDAQTREILQFELLRIWESRPMSMVFVTHSIEEAVLMGDRVVVLRGRPSSIDQIIETGLPRPRTRDVFSTPRFNEVREQVWSLLMREAEQAERELQEVR